MGETPKTALHQEDKPQDYWDDSLEQATHKRNCQMKDAVNKAARFIVHYCLRHQIGNIVLDGMTDRKIQLILVKPIIKRQLLHLGRPQDRTASTLYKFRQQDLKTAFKN